MTEIYLDIFHEFAQNPKLSLDYIHTQLQQYELWDRRVNILNKIQLISVFHNREDVLQNVIFVGNNIVQADIFYFAVSLGRFSIVRFLFKNILRYLELAENNINYSNIEEDYIQLDDFIMRIYNLWKHKLLPNTYIISNPQSYFSNRSIEVIGTLGLYTDKTLSQAVPGYVPTVGNLECDPEKMFKFLIELGYRFKMLPLMVITQEEEKWLDHLDAHDNLFQKKWWRTWYTSFIHAKTKKTFRPLEVRYHRYLQYIECSDKLVYDFCPVPRDIIRYVIVPYLHEELKEIKG
jgi:hypothetical protein